MNQTQSASASEKSVRSSCQPLVETLAKLGSVWAAHGLRIGRDAVRMSAETLGKTVETLDALAAEFEKRAAKAASETAPETGEAAVEKTGDAAAEQGAPTETAAPAAEGQA